VDHAHRPARTLERICAATAGSPIFDDLGKAIVVFEAFCRC
jgi:hypothetical protein